MSGNVAMAYIAMARGSPWVVPSLDGMHSPPIKSYGSERYVFVDTVPRAGQRLLMLASAAFLFKQLKALDASTSRTPSVDSSS